MFLDNLKDTLENEYNVSQTENGAIGYKTSGKYLLDLNFALSSMRKWSKEEIIEAFVKAFYENKMLAIKWLFFVGDPRGGNGERRIFKIIFKYLAENHKDLTRSILPLVPHYTRWDNLWPLFDTELSYDVAELVYHQILVDDKSIDEGKPISLLGKWLPSINSYSDETKKYAKKLINHLEINNKTYREICVYLRKCINIVESKMCAGEWDHIDYSQVPSRANLIYSNAFMKHDPERRKVYLALVSEGKAKINASTLFPHDIVHKYITGDYRGYNVDVIPGIDETAEALWNNLPNYIGEEDNVLVLADGSGSMFSNKVSKTDITCLDVSMALAIYFAERMKGAFKNKYITFGGDPQFVDISNCKNLKEKLEYAIQFNDYRNTDIRKVFALLLRTAIKHNMSQEEFPKAILILSDMEFDAGIDFAEEKLFNEISKVYQKEGYQLPRLVFWNICSRTNTIPVKENKLGVALVSGFSPSIIKMVLSNKTDPYEVLVEQLNSERYSKLESVLKDII